MVHRLTVRSLKYGSSGGTHMEFALALVLFRKQHARDEYLQQTGLPLSPSRLH